MVPLIITFLQWGFVVTTTVIFSSDELYWVEMFQANRV